MSEVTSIGFGHAPWWDRLYWVYSWTLLVSHSQTFAWKGESATLPIWGLLWHHGWAMSTLIATLCCYNSGISSKLTLLIARTSLVPGLAESLGMRLCPPESLLFARVWLCETKLWCWNVTCTQSVASMLETTASPHSQADVMQANSFLSLWYIEQTNEFIERMNEWMDGMDGWMTRWTNKGWRNEWLNIWMKNG